MATTNKDLALPTHGASNWDAPLNSNFSIIDAALGSVQPIVVTGLGAYSLTLTDTFPIVSTPVTSASYIPMRILLTGVLSGAMGIIVPPGVEGLWVVSNYTSGSFPVTFGGSTLVQTIPQASDFLVYCDGVNAVIVGTLISPGSTASIGDVKFSASSNAQAGWLLCYGQPVSRTTYAALFAAIGTTYGAGDGSTTFNIPPGRGCVLAGADNMGGSAAGVLPGYVLGTVGGSYQVTVAVNQMPAHTHTDTGHLHATTEVAHHHSTVASGIGTTAGGSFSVSGYSASGVTGSALTGITVNTGTANLQNTGGGNPLSIVQPTLALNMFIYAGV